ncbi:MAG: signal recognition particle-docking protein FtsY [Candidatus Methanoliparum thermophilum]|uniref:Signal recognition particle receptor FtsY n=1 Tax=Methanoliparum thermophilum TaxID=2491083 RepID=A0A520KU33_METT2|nr:signal recognition particle-docking protein FtsY [Candidatus Methanoliparum sp. LAM-1]RZN65426.1 MAG: signal recognition particle-docking protein FtsY [Candidatus Methanoliparum thermophilum]BDC35485.1 signal recognition particle-docking protein FtsY [Candidatus Methanoliparum sp. LAM-1]
MFKSLREKLSSVKESISRTIHDKDKEKVTSLEDEIETISKKEDLSKEEKAQKLGFIKKAKTFLLEGESILNEKDLEEPLWNLELALMEGNVALLVVEAIVSSVKSNLIGRKKKLLAHTDEIVEDVLYESIKNVIKNDGLSFDEIIEKSDKPVVILFVGVNGTGKTTTIAKVAKRLKDKGYSVVLASGDTYRTGALEQLEIHGERLGLKVIKHQYGSDPSAVIYDAIEHAKARGIDVVLADTAGRMHTNSNLMRELQKIKRINSPDLTIFVDEAIAGNDALERAKLFDEAIGLDGTILTKLDTDAKGGTAISISYITGKPIFFFGTGQSYDDLIIFQEDWLLNKIFGNDSEEEN